MLRKLFVGCLFLSLLVMGCGVIARSQPTPTPTRTPKPTFTATSTFAPPVVMATATPLPMETPITSPTDTPVPAAADTPVPTDTPLPTDTPAPTKPPAPPPPPAPTATPVPPPPPPPGKDFKIAKRQLMCGHGGHAIFITVIDINGAPLDGVVLKVTDPDPNTKDVEIITGDKGPGKAEYLMWGEQWVWVERDASGKTYGKDRSEIAEHVDRRPPAWDLKAVGECEGLTDEECEQKRDACDGSYDLVFQRQW